jgi:uncharacterized lipoprotein YehR (DUF1307 family)
MKSKEMLLNIFIAIMIVVILSILVISLAACTVAYKTHNTGQKYKHFEIRIFHKRDTVPFDTLRVQPIKINH